MKRQKANKSRVGFFIREGRQIQIIDRKFTDSAATTVTLLQERSFSFPGHRFRVDVTRESTRVSMPEKKGEKTLKLSENKELQSSIFLENGKYSTFFLLFGNYWL